MPQRSGDYGPLRRTALILGGRIGLVAAGAILMASGTFAPLTRNGLSITTIIAGSILIGSELAWLRRQPDSGTYSARGSMTSTPIPSRSRTYLRLQDQVDKAFEQRGDGADGVVHRWILRDLRSDEIEVAA